MAEIRHRFPVQSPAARVFAAVATSAGLDSWWTLTSAGTPEPGNTYEFGFGAEYQWSGQVTRCESGTAIEWEFTEAMDDWTGTRVGFEFRENGGVTEVDFYHTGWREADPHFRTTSYCWAMYLRLLRRFVESGEIVPYADRLAA